MTQHLRLPSPCLPSNQIRELVVDIEHLGVDSSRLAVTADPARSTTETSRVDRRTVARPALRVGMGLVAGVLLGLAVGLVVVAVTDALTAPTLLGLAIGGALLGGLAGLYARLTMNTDVSDVDAGQGSRLVVDVEGLDEETVAAVRGLIERNSGPDGRV